MKKQLLKKFYACQPVGMAFIFTAMMFSASANAQIVYTDVNPDYVVSAVTLSSTIDYNIDLNNDGISDYKISCVSTGASCFTYRLYINYVSVTALNSNAVVATTSTTYPLAMNFNDSILSGLPLSTSGYLRYVRTGAFRCSGSTIGVWPNSIDHYLGLKLIVGTNTYYGWARMQVNIASGNSSSCTIKDYAYNTIPDQPILAGQTNALGIIENSIASSINLFPNPATNHLTIALGTDIRKVQVSIADITGKLIYTTIATDTQKVEVDTNDFADGIYVVQIQAEDFIVSKKLVVKK